MSAIALFPKAQHQITEELAEIYIYQDINTNKYLRLSELSLYFPSLLSVISDSKKQFNDFITIETFEKVLMTNNELEKAYPKLFILSSLLIEKPKPKNIESNLGVPNLSTGIQLKEKDIDRIVDRVCEKIFSEFMDSFKQYGETLEQLQEKISSISSSREKLKPNTAIIKDNPKMKKCKGQSAIAVIRNRKRYGLSKTMGVIKLRTPNSYAARYKGKFIAIKRTEKLAACAYDDFLYSQFGDMIVPYLNYPSRKK